MKIAIIGLPNSGKTSVFNALTRGTAETASFSSGRLEPNLATVKVPDARLGVLNEIYSPKKLTAAEVQYVDIGGFSGAGKREDAVPSEVLHYIGTADAFLHVIRAFEDEKVPHPSGSVDIKRDWANLELELIFSDLAIVERRLEKLEKEIRKMAGAEKSRRIAEQEVLQRLLAFLEDERPIREAGLTEPEEKLLRGYQFLSAKPVLVVVNIGEGQIGSEPTLELGDSSVKVVALSAKVEAELAQLEDEDAQEFMGELGIVEPARDRVIEDSYALLGLVSFLTVGEDEVRAWTIRQGMKAPEAGGVIHSDIQRGFIRAEVVTFDELVKAGSMVQAKKNGVVRLEGKEYLIKDGDIAHFLFNV